MKETIKINLSGQLFDLDSDAYDKLKSYLDSIKHRFGNSPEEAKEILEDIESRIAEILQEKLSETKQVVTLPDVEEIISLMGTAEEMDSTEDEAEEPKKSNWKHNFKGNKRFYRDPQNKVFGGVCSGLGSYFSIDPIWIRLVFVILFFANLAGLVIYAVLWIVLPQAKTTAQRLEMQGKRVTLNDIEGSVKKEYEKVKTNVKNIPNSAGYKQAEGAVSEIFSVLGNIIIIFLKVIGAILAITLVITLVITVLGLIIGGIGFFPWNFMNDWQFPHMINWPNLSLIGLCLFLVITIPILAVLIKLFRWIFDIRSNNRVAAGIGATIWVIAFISLVVLVVVESDRGLFRKQYSSEYQISATEGKPLYIKLKNSKIDEDEVEYYQIFNYQFAYDDYRDEFLKTPSLEIIEANSDDMKLIMNRSYANFYIGKTPKNQFEIIDYGWRLSDTLLILDEYYSCDDDNAWRLPNLNLSIEIPEGQKVFIDKDIAGILDMEYMANQLVIMENSDLKIVNK